MISLSGQIEEVEYELQQRAKVYPRIAASRAQRQSVLDHHVKRMEAVLATLQWLEKNEAAIKGAAEGN